MASITQQSYHPSDEYAQVVWASHILSYLNPYTSYRADGQPARVRDIVAEDDDDDSEDDLGDKTSNLAFFGAGDESVLREKFLDCVAELLACRKGGRYVAATALREGNNSVEIDIAGNSPFSIECDEWLALLSRFLASRGTRDTAAAPTGAAGTTTNTGARHEEEEDSGHLLLELTVTRNADRLDQLIHLFAKLLRKSTALALSTTTQPAGEPRLLPDDAEYQPTCLADTTRELAKAVLEWPSSSASNAAAATTTATRLGVVALAAVAVRSPEAAATELKRIAPSMDTNKAMRFYRLIARPATNLLIMARVAQLLPNFRAVTFVKVSTPGFTRLDRPRQTPGLAEAWRRLQLPPLNQLPASLSRKEYRFRRECARAFPVHCDAQLLLRYEAEPSMTPTLPYLGCSKRACFLCHSMVSLLTFQPRVRGYHGVCHPLWGVGLPQSQHLRQPLEQLCGLIKEKIVALLALTKRPVPYAVPQSSAVSNLCTTDLAGIRRRESAKLEQVEKANQELRERMQVLLHPRSIRPPPRRLRSNLVCIMCQSTTTTTTTTTTHRSGNEEAGRCKDCLSVSYCSTRCWSVDRPAHQLLCPSYLVFMGTRPSSVHKLAIWFPGNHDRPRLVWVHVPVPTTHQSQQPTDSGGFLRERHADQQRQQQPTPELSAFFGPQQQHTCPSATIMTHNNRRGIEVGHEIRIYQQPADTCGLHANRSVRHAVEACHGMTVPGKADGGPLVAMAAVREANGLLPPGVVDMTLSDFRHVLDLFSTRGDDTVRETPTGGTIQALRISCELQQKLYGHDVFSVVFIQSDLPFEEKEQSALCEMLGGAQLLVCRPRDDGHLDSTTQVGDDYSVHNTYATALTTDMDRSSGGWGAPPKPWEGGAIVARSDRADLDIHWAMRVCRYCVEVLQPTFQRARAGEMKRKAALREVTPQKLAAFSSNP